VCLRSCKSRAPVTGARTVRGGGRSMWTSALVSSVFWSLCWMCGVVELPLLVVDASCQKSRFPRRASCLATFQGVRRMSRGLHSSPPVSVLGSLCLSCALFFGLADPLAKTVLSHAHNLTALLSLWICNLHIGLKRSKMRGWRVRGRMIP
jgi:hypothetical protein